MEDIQQVFIDDAHYPELLKKISDAAKVLYYRGILPDSKEMCIGIVGTRHPSPYGQQTTLQIAGELAGAGVAIVSGMAPGIDTFSHQACIEKGKRTIAVLGTGLDEKSMYPQQNVQLSRKIIAHGGCLISELPPGTHGSKFTFPKRNRIISGLSLGILVIEAKEKSGSLITAKYATQQKKKIFAVPGSIFSSNSKGPNKLIKDGATLVESANDILAKLGLVPFSFKKNNVSIEDSKEKCIFEALKEEPLYIDNIIDKTKLDASVVATTLALMEISGTIRSLGGNIYSLNKK